MWYYKITLKIENKLYSKRKVKKYLKLKTYYKKIFNNYYYKFSNNFLKLGYIETYNNNYFSIRFNKGIEIKIFNIIMFFINNYKGYITFKKPYKNIFINFNKGKINKIQLKEEF